METIAHAEFLDRLKAQGVSSRNHVALKCPICSTVQSMASLVRAGCKPDQVDSVFGWSCEGRLTNAGSWPGRNDQSEKAQARRQVRGCDWTLGGLLHLHDLEVIMDGKKQPCFDIATPEEAQALEALAPVEVVTIPV